MKPEHTCTGDDCSICDEYKTDIEQQLAEANEILTEISQARPLTGEDAVDFRSMANVYCSKYNL